MASIKLILLVAINFVAHSLQDSPITDFCRRWAHQTALVDQRLYIDGGQVAYSNLNYNHTNEYLVFSDLKSRSGDGFPIQYSNLSKPANIPSVSGGYLWSDEVNKCFYSVGGEFPDGNPKDFNIYTFDILLNQWNATDYKSSDRNWQRPAYGAGAQVESRGMGYLYGGWISNRTTPGYKGPPLALNSMMQFDFTTGNLKNSTHPDGIGRAEGQLLYLPASDGGLLVYLGGVEDTYRNGSYNAANMTKIHIHDINSGKWYNQTASGDVPLPRRQFCAGVTWADDRSSFNIYLYGGYGFGTPAAFDDVYILSLPSFKWVKGYPLGGGDSNQFGHGGCSATVVNPDQMMVIGGWFPNTSFVECDAPSAQGQHNMVLGSNTGKEENGLWDKYDPNLSSYVVPSQIIAAIGGGPTGGATVTSPSSWDHPDLKVYYKTTRLASASRTATRLLPGSTGSPNGSKSSKKNIGAIAGGVVGGLAVLIVVLGLILLCLHRRKKARNEKPEATPVTAPAELDVSRYPHEMSTTTASKYVAVHEQADAHHQYGFPASTPYQSQAMNYDRNLPQGDATQSYAPTSPHAIRKHSSHQNSSYSHPYTSPLRSPRNEEQFFTDTQDGYSTHEEGPSQQSSQSQHKNATPISPQRPASENTSQVYYPPPQDSLRHPQPSRNLPPGDQRGSPTDTQYSGETRHGYTPSLSTTNTPAQFYTQRMARGDRMSGEGGYR